MADLIALCLFIVALILIFAMFAIALYRRDSRG